MVKKGCMITNPNPGVEKMEGARRATGIPSTAAKLWK